MEYSIGKIAEVVGLTTYTLRYYEKEGLLPPIKRKDNGIRVFSNDDIAWIDFVNCMRKTGMSIADLKNIIELSKAGEHTLLERKQLLKEHRESVLKQMEELQGFIDKIDVKLKFYDDKTAECK